MAYWKGHSSFAESHLPSGLLDERKKVALFIS